MDNFLNILGILSVSIGILSILFSIAYIVSSYQKKNAIKNTATLKPQLFYIDVSDTTPPNKIRIDYKPEDAVDIAKSSQVHTILKNYIAYNKVV